MVQRSGVGRPRQQGARGPAGNRAAASPPSKGARTAQWRALVARIEADIKEGRLAQGEKLPPETKHAEQAGVSRHTLRRALAELARLGLVRISRRGGTFVAPARVTIDIGVQSRLAESMIRAGLAPGGRLISFTEGIAPPEVAGLLRVARRTRVVELVHVRVANGLPFCAVTAWSPADRFQRLGRAYEQTGSMRRAFAQLGVTGYRHARARITARRAARSEREQLGLEPHAVLLELELLHVDSTGEPIQLARYRFGADRVEILAEIERRPSPDVR